jgi:deazaflavin-dependent oxidoreductase (nitroreductase family)
MQIALLIFFLLAGVAVPALLLRFRRRWVAGFNSAVTNRITGTFANRLPGFGILSHVGRNSGRTYRTPINVFRRPDGFLIALTYGSESEWVKNVLAKGRCRLETRGVQYELNAPKVVLDPTRKQFPLLARIVLRLVGADEFLKLSTSSS